MAMNVRYEMAIAGFSSLSAAERKSEAVNFAAYVAARYPSRVDAMRAALGELSGALAKVGREE